MDANMEPITRSAFSVTPIMFNHSLESDAKG